MCDFGQCLAVHRLGECACGLDFVAVVDEAALAGALAFALAAALGGGLTSDESESDSERDGASAVALTLGLV